MQCHDALAWRLLLIALCFTDTVLAEDAQEVDEEKEAASEKDGPRLYKQPDSEGLHWVDTFDGDAMSRWVASTKEKYDGKFKVEKRRREGLIGDVGLLVTEPAKHYGISSTLPALTGTKDLSFVLQFEVQFQDGLQCGGSYVKVFDRKEQKSADFDNDTPYIIMFGPDRCGGTSEVGSNTNKVHFILRHQSPKTGKWEEKHLKSQHFAVPEDHLTHLYTLIINPDNSFEIQLDGVQKVSGDLLTSMEPPINPPKEIDDPSDSKPEDWIDEAKMNDPSASKPDDWDEDEPHSIPDPDAKMPSGWREDVTEKRIPDPSAKIPADWDEEEDGEWEAPTIDNPDCKVGCGKWNPPTISNPKYKGKWHPPKIDNPAYKGIWNPRQIANPDFFEDKAPSMLPTVNGVGIDIWSMQGGILFDNFVIATDPKKVKAFADETWSIRSNIEELQKPKSSLGSSILDSVSNYALPIGIAVVIGILGTIYFCCCQGSTVPPPRNPKAPKKKRDASPGLTEEKDPGDEGEDEDKDAAKAKDEDDKKED